VLRKRVARGHELVYDNYNALAIGYGPNERTSEAFVSLACFAKGVHLYFTHGKSLPDPHHILEGGGNQGRFVRFRGAATVRDPRVEALLSAASRRGPTPLAPTGRGITVIKSISAKQRPRRPSAPPAQTAGKRPVRATGASSRAKPAARGR
jgi:hypothetical protein